MDQAYEALQWASKIWFRLLNLFQGLGFWWFGLSRNGGKAMISKKTPSLCKDFLLPGSENRNINPGWEETEPSHGKGTYSK